MLAFFESPVQLLIVGMIVLLLFGNRLPSVMDSLRQGTENFRRLLPCEQTQMLAWLERQEKKRQQSTGIPFNWVLIGLVNSRNISGRLVGSGALTNSRDDAFPRELLKCRSTWVSRSY